MNISPLFLTDFYKQGHHGMYAKGMTKLYSNLTARKSRITGVNHVRLFGLQYFLEEYLIRSWNTEFFSREWSGVKARYLELINATLGPGTVSVDHIKQLHDLGYLPLSIKALPEGVKIPIRVPCVTITNTVDHAGWLVNFIESLLSCVVWQPCTTLTIAAEFLSLFKRYELATTGETGFAQWQGHDFSMRGMSSLESACVSGAAHLASGFTGTDCVPALPWLSQHYAADYTKELVGASVPATEHSVMCLGNREGELETFERLLDTFPTGILSIVSDTWSLPYVITEILPKLKDKIMARNGKVVIRPDSFWTDPVDCLCGFDGYHPQMEKMTPSERDMIRAGLVESLWNLFGGTVSPAGYRVLDSHIGSIYGDSISYERAERICDRLAKKGFASTNWVAGIGSFTYQYNTRDTFGFAMKATYGVVDGEPRDIYKDPITDDGMKKSAKGLLCVKNVYGAYLLLDQVTPEEEAGGELKEVFRDGDMLKYYTLAEVRANVLRTS